jgi:hypothetical protein
MQMPHDNMPHMVAITWAALRNACTQVRLNALHRDRTNIQLKLTTITSNNDQVKRMMEQLDHMYTQHNQNVQDYYQELTTKVAMYMPATLQSIVRMYHELSDTIMETTLPDFLTQQLKNLSDGNEINMDLEALTVTTQWTKVTKAGYVRGNTTTSIKSAPPLSPWASPQVVDDIDDNSAYLPTSMIHFQRDDSLQSELNRFRAGLQEKKEASDVKGCCFQADVGHLTAHINRDASVYRTAYIRINGITPVMSLPDADMNMNATLTLIKSILRPLAGSRRTLSIALITLTSVGWYSMIRS